MFTASSQNTTNTPRPKDYGLYIGFLALMAWLPLPLGSNRPWAWHLFEAVCFGFLIWWLVLYLKDKVQASEALKNGRLPIGCLLAFCVAIFIQLIPLPTAIIEALRPVIKSLEPGNWLTITIDPYATWVRLRLSIAFTIIVFLTLALITTKERLRTLAIVLVIGGVLQAVYGSLMTLSGTEYGFLLEKQFYLGTATGTFVNRNHFANYLVLCLALGTGLLLADLYQTASGGWREHGRRLLTTLLGSKLRLRVGLAIMVIALVLSRSRMGNSTFFFSLLVAGFLWLLFTKRITKGSILLLVSLVVIDTFIVGAWFGLDEVKERIEGTNASSEARLEVNRDTWQLIQSQPLLGSGAGSYETAFPRFRQADIHQSFDYAHNDYLQFLAEQGVIGCLPLLLFVIMGLFKAIKAMRTRKTLIFQAMAFAPLMAIIASLMHAIVEFNFQIPANAATFLVLITLGWSLLYIPAKQGLRRKRVVE